MVKNDDDDGYGHGSPNYNHGVVDKVRTPVRRAEPQEVDNAARGVKPGSDTMDMEG